MHGPRVPTFPIDAVRQTGSPSSDVLLDRLLAQRIVLVGQTLDDAAADALVAQLTLLAAEDTKRDITLTVRARYCAVDAALAVHDVLRGIAPDVVTVAAGVLDPAATLLVAAGAPGRRHAAAHSVFHLPQPDGSGGLQGHFHDAAVALLGRYTDGQVGTAADERADERWLDAPAAQARGIVDQVAA